MTAEAIQVVFSFLSSAFRKAVSWCRCDKLLESGPILVPSETASPKVLLVPGGPRVSPGWSWTGGQFSAM